MRLDAHKIIGIFIALAFVLITLPAISTEMNFQTISQHGESCFQLMLSLLLSVAVRANAEFQERSEIVSRSILRKKFLKEKGMRFTAEHEAECGPFSRKASVMRQRQVMAALSAVEAQTPRRLALEQLFELSSAANCLIDMNSGKFKVSSKVLARGNCSIAVAGELCGVAVSVKFPRPESSFPAGLGEELLRLRRLRHPNLLAMHGIFADISNEAFAVVEEHVVGPSLKELRMETCLDARSMKDILLGVASALRYLHQQEPVIVHGKLHPGIICVEHRGRGMQAKLAAPALGLATKGPDTDSIDSASWRWCAPEAGKVNPLPAAADVFSFAKVTYFVVAGKLPHAEIYDGTFAELGQNGQAPQLAWSTEFMRWSKECQKLCETCLNGDFTKRPSIAEAYDEVRSWLDGHPMEAIGSSLAWSDELRRIRSSLVKGRFEQIEHHRAQKREPSW